jgi:hypothetical protein
LSKTYRPGTPHYSRAAVVAQGVYAHDEAIALAGRGLSLLQKLPARARRDAWELEVAAVPRDAKPVLERLLPRERDEKRRPSTRARPRPEWPRPLGSAGRSRKTAAGFAGREPGVSAAGEAPRSL